MFRWTSSDRKQRWQQTATVIDIYLEHLPESPVGKPVEVNGLREWVQAIAFQAPRDLALLLQNWQRARLS
jgi:hypothetical protein